MFLVQNSWPISTANLHNFLIGSLKLVADFIADFIDRWRNVNFDFEAYCWFCRFFALLFRPSIFFWLGLSSATRNSINSEKNFCFLLISIHASSADEVWY